MNGNPLTVLVNWTAHTTFMDAEDMLFSGDWPATALYWLMLS